jgi:anti-sigma-K factor RskA
MAKNTHVTDWIPAYALGCLEDEEAKLVASHLQHCPLCQAEMHDYQMVVDDMAEAVPQVEPASDLKQRLLQHVEQREPATPLVQLLWHQLIHLLTPVGPLWAPLSVVLIVALAVGNVLLWQQANAIPSNTLPAPASDVQDFHMVRLAGTSTTPLASGIIIMDPADREGTLVVYGLPPLGDQQQYQLWLIRDTGERVNGAVFSVSESGYGSIGIYAGEPLSHFATFGVTVEPAGGSSGPTGDKVLSTE